MLLTHIWTRKKESRNRGSGEATAIADDFKGGGKTIAFEIDLHLPCRVAGITRNGSRWEGDTTTVSLSSFGAHLLLPVEAELEGDISLTFKIPPPLRSLFAKRKFYVKAEIQPSGAAVIGLAAQGRKVVCVTFSEPVRFTLPDAVSKK